MLSVLPNELIQYLIKDQHSALEHHLAIHVLSQAAFKQPWLRPLESSLQGGTVCAVFSSPKQRMQYLIKDQHSALEQIIQTIGRAHRRVQQL